VTTERDRALQTALGQIERAHGKGAIMRLGDVQAQHIDIIPTGALTLDIALGVGGIPRGRIVEVYGPESSGKTRRSAAVASPPSSTPSTRSIHSTRRASG
jgi:recombination protein RecA